MKEWVIHHPRVSPVSRESPGGTRPCIPDSDGIHSYVPQVRLEDRFQHMTQRSLHHSVAHRRYERLQFLVPRFGDPHPLHRSRLVLVPPQCASIFSRFASSRRATSLPSHDRFPSAPPLACTPRNACPRLPPSNLVHQAKPLPSFDSLFQSCQHTGCPYFRFDRTPSCADVSRLFSRYGHCREFVFRASVHSVFHLPASLDSTPITALPRYYGRCDSSARSLPNRGLPDSCTWPSCHSVPNHLCCPASLYHATPQRTGLPPCRGRASPQARRLAANTGRIGFVILRTGSSLPVAPHLVSRRRNNSSLQAGERCLKRTFTSPTKYTFRRTSPRIHAGRSASALRERVEL